MSIPARYTGPLYPPGRTEKTTTTHRKFPSASSVVLPSFPQPKNLPPFRLSETEGGRS